MSVGSGERQRQRHSLAFRVVEVCILTATTLLGLRELSQQVSSKNGGPETTTTTVLLFLIQVIAVTAAVVVPAAELLLAHHSTILRPDQANSYCCGFLQPRSAASQGVAVGSFLLPGLYTATVVWQQAHSISGVDQCGSSCGDDAQADSVVVNQQHARWLQSVLAVFACSFVGVIIVLHDIVLQSCGWFARGSSSAGAVVGGAGARSPAASVGTAIVAALLLVGAAGALWWLLPFASCLGSQCLTPDGCVSDDASSSFGAATQAWWALPGSAAELAAHPALLVVVYLCLQVLVGMAAPRTFTIGESQIAVQALTLAVLNVVSDSIISRAGQQQLQQQQQQQQSTGTHQIDAGAEEDFDTHASLLLLPMGLEAPSALSTQQLTARSAISAGLLMAAAMGVSLPALQRLLVAVFRSLLSNCRPHRMRAAAAASSSSVVPWWLPSAVFWALLVLELSFMVVPFLAYRLNRPPLHWIFSYMVGIYLQSYNHQSLFSVALTMAFVVCCLDASLLLPCGGRCQQ